MKPIATLVNNSQPGWTNIIETEPNVTISVGEKLWLDKDVQEILLEQKKLVGQLDLALNGPEQADRQASLYDLVSQLDRFAGTEGGLLGENMVQRRSYNMLFDSIEEVLASRTALTERYNRLFETGDFLAIRADIFLRASEELDLARGKEDPAEFLALLDHWTGAFKALKRAVADWKKKAEG